MILDAFVMTLLSVALCRADNIGGREDVAAVDERGFVTVRGVAYRDGDPGRCVMDIYRPAVRGARMPVIIWLHGGGLTGGERFLPDELMTGDYVVVAPGYRLLPDVDVEDCIDDAAASVAWVMDNAESIGGDPDLIFLSGHSAGGYLTSMVGLDKSRLARYGKDPDMLAGLIPYSGQVITHFAKRREMGMGELTPLADDLAPLCHVRGDCPPYVIITGDREMELYGRYEENLYMWRMMKLNGHNDVRIYEIDGYNHGDMAVPAHHILKNEVGRIMEAKQE